VKQSIKRSLRPDADTTAQFRRSLGHCPVEPGRMRRRCDLAALTADPPPRRNPPEDRARGDHRLSGHLTLPARRGGLLGDFSSAPRTERFSARPTSALSQALCCLVLAVIQDDRRNLHPVYHRCWDLPVLGSLWHCGIPLSWVSAKGHCPLPTVATQTSPLRQLALLERWP